MKVKVTPVSSDSGHQPVLVCRAGFGHVSPFDSHTCDPISIIVAVYQVRYLKCVMMHLFSKMPLMTSDMLILLETSHANPVRNMLATW